VISEQCSDVPMPVNKMMSWNDIRQLEQDGFIIGSHSHTHPFACEPGAGRRNFGRTYFSARTIMQETGKLPQTISYPVGNYDERVVRCQKRQDIIMDWRLASSFLKWVKMIISNTPCRIAPGTGMESANADQRHL